MLETYLPNVNWEKMWEATVETLFMTGTSVIAVFVFGIVRFNLVFNFKGKPLGE